MPKFNVSCSSVINASIDDVFSVVRNFKSWPRWSPWLIFEPECEVTHPDDGKSYSWDGKIVGSGQMEIIGESSSDSIDYRLTFLKPWKSTSKVRFEFVEKEGLVEVSWKMEGSLPFFMFWMKPMMVKWMEMDFGRGLAMLKDFIETGSVPSQMEFVGLSRLEGCEYVGVRSRCSISDVGPQMESDFGKLYDWTSENAVESSGKPFAIYHKYEMVKGFTEYTIGMPVASMPIALGDGIVSGTRAAAEVYSITHTGPYRHLGNGWSAGMMFARSKVFKQNKTIAPFEIYENSPKDVSENELKTTVCFPVK